MSGNKKAGRPIGGKYPEEIRKVWREYKRQQRSKQVQKIQSEDT